MTMPVGVAMAMPVDMTVGVAVNVLADVAAAMGVMAAMAAFGGSRCGHQHDGKGGDQDQEALADRHGLSPRVSMMSDPRRSLIGLM
jgi:hypothetical protein